MQRLYSTKQTCDTELVVFVVLFVDVFVVEHDWE